MVSWIRLLNGRFRDPIVGRDILAGCLLGSLWALMRDWGPWITTWDGGPRGDSVMKQLNGLLGAQNVFHIAARNVRVGCETDGRAGLDQKAEDAHGVGEIDVVDLHDPRGDLPLAPCAKGQHMGELLIDGRQLAAQQFVQKFGVPVHHSPSPVTWGAR